jgi:hypothetical protein
MPDIYHAECWCTVIKPLKPRIRRSTNYAAAPARPKARRLRGMLGQLMRDTRASVVIFMAVAMVALATATGVGVDYARGEHFKIALQGMVDAAAISAASVYLNAGYATQATTVADNYLLQAKSHLPPNNNDVTYNVALSASPPYTVTVTATGSINSSFNGLLMKTIPVSAIAVAHGPNNPNIDFYLLLDSSPSMGIAATVAGINTMVANTPGQCDNVAGTNPYGGATCGCGIACHESHPSSESHYIPTGTGSPVCQSNGTNCNVSGTGNPGGEDNYALARALGVTLRIDNLITATQNLMTTAQNTMANNSAVYRVAINSFDLNFNTIQALTSNLTTAQTSAGNIALLQMYSNNHYTSGDNNQDADTNYDNAMNQVNTLMPDPGGGTTNAGDTPQEVLFFVTDGVEDEMVSGSRQESLMDNGWCTTIKNRGIRIAVLYTEYFPLPTNAWYNAHVASYQSNIGATLQACASPNFYFKVDTGGDISAAMTALFDTVVQSAYLSK